MLNDDGTILNPTGMGCMKAGALKATWNKSTLEYEWELGQYVTVGLEDSVRGLYEPTFGLLDNNKVLMIMRNSNYRQSDEIIGAKFYSVSHDNAITWSSPQILTYDDDTIMYSSSCIAKLLNHSNGNLYYIGVINDENPQGNLPRYPLCIAKVDKNSLKIIKHSVTIIDTKRKNHETSVKTSNVVDYSNQGIYEDRETGNIIVLAPYREDLTQYRSYLNKYTIEVD